jgi:alpha-L-rhamnosidase
MLGDLLIWYYENLAGIKAKVPGFKEITMKPEEIAGLNHVKASFLSPYGNISSNYTRSKKDFNWQISVPVNTVAEVYLPANHPTQIKESGKAIDKASGIQFLRKEGKRLVYQVSSGNYQFQIK